MDRGAEAEHHGGFAAIRHRRARTRDGISSVTAGAGPPLFLFHGGSGSANHWVRNVGPLSARFTVHALDLPGFGESDDAPDDATDDAYVDLVARSVIELADGPAHLAGFSFGSVVAARTAAALGEAVARLSIVGPAGFGRPAERRIRPIGLKTLRARLGREPTPADIREMHRHNVSEVMLSEPASIDDEAVDLQAWNVARSRFVSQRFSWASDMVGTLRDLAVPVQAIYGTEDRTAVPSMAARIDECRAARPDLEVLRLDRVGHWAQYEAADAVNVALVRFHLG